MENKEEILTVIIVMAISKIDPCLSDFDPMLGLFEVLYQKITW